MVPPKVGAPIHMSRRSHRYNRSSLEPIVEAKNPTHIEGVVDVNAIPSLESVSLTFDEEKPE